MKRTLLACSLLFFSAAVFSQETADEEKDEEKGGFKKHLLFTGGTLNVGFFNGVTVLGATPQLGYNVARWLDAGIVFGYTYMSQNDGFTKYRNRIIGPGAFVRLFPIDNIFATAQYEHNFLTQKIISSGFTDVDKTSVSSLLLGLGYTSGRDGGRNSPYYYFSVSVDVLNNPNSPYRTFQNQIFPVVNAGFNIPLFQGSR